MQCPIVDLIVVYKNIGTFRVRFNSVHNFYDLEIQLLDRIAKI